MLNISNVQYLKGVDLNSFFQFWDTKMGLMFGFGDIIKKRGLMATKGPLVVINFARVDGDMEGDGVINFAKVDG